MKIIISFLIFCLVLFIYLHIQFHLKTSDDLEMYEVDGPSKDRLEEICDIRQPVLFDFDCQKIIDTTNINFVSTHYPAFELKIRNITDKDDLNNELYVPLPLHVAMKLFNEDKSASYFTENNSEFLQETGVFKSMQYNDEFLRPNLVSNCNYDIITGSEGTFTPFRYQINYRNYFLLTQGSAQIKLSPPHSSKYLYTIYDYENFEFKSPVNVWSPQPKYLNDFDKIKCLEFTLTPGKTLFIPAYWWYSIKFSTNTSITSFNYRTYMNNLAISNHIGLHVLQIQNVKRNIVKTHDIKEKDLKSTINIIEKDLKSEEQPLQSDQEKELNNHKENNLKTDLENV